MLLKLFTISKNNINYSNFNIKQLLNSFGHISNKNHYEILRTPTKENTLTRCTSSKDVAVCKELKTFENFGNPIQNVHLEIYNIFKKNKNVDSKFRIFKRNFCTTVIDFSKYDSHNENNNSQIEDILDKEERKLIQNLIGKHVLKTNNKYIKPFSSVKRKLHTNYIEFTKDGKISGNKGKIDILGKEDRKAIQNLNEKHILKTNIKYFKPFSLVKRKFHTNYIEFTTDGKIIENKGKINILGKEERKAIQNLDEKHVLKTNNKPFRLVKRKFHTNYIEFTKDGKISENKGKIDILNKEERKAIQNLNGKCIIRINDQINTEFIAAYTYLSMYSFCTQDNVALHGFAKLFLNSFNEEIKHANKLIKYLNERGGQLCLMEIPCCETQCDWISIDHMICKSLEMEKYINSKILAIHQCASTCNDPSLTDFLEEYFIQEQVEAIKYLSDLSTIIKRAGPGLGVYMVDRDLLNDQISLDFHKLEK